MVALKINDMKLSSLKYSFCFADVSTILDFKWFFPRWHLYLQKLQFVVQHNNDDNLSALYNWSAFISNNEGHLNKGWSDNVWVFGQFLFERSFLVYSRPHLTDPYSVGPKLGTGCHRTLDCYTAADACSLHQLIHVTQISVTITWNQIDAATNMNLPTTRR